MESLFRIRRVLRVASRDASCGDGPSQEMFPFCSQHAHCFVLQQTHNVSNTCQSGADDVLHRLINVVAERKINFKQIGSVRNANITLFDTSSKLKLGCNVISLDTFVF